MLDGHQFLQQWHKLLVADLSSGNKHGRQFGGHCQQPLFASPEPGNCGLLCAAEDFWQGKVHSRRRYLLKARMLDGRKSRNQFLQLFSINRPVA